MKKLNHKKLIIFLLSSLLLVSSALLAQKPSRRGTTAANFLEIGYGCRGNAMGDAVVSVVNDLSSVYWNPAGLALMRQSGVQFVYQPWIADINTSFAAAGLVLPNLGTFAVGYYQVDYGREEVTTMEMQDGTGEHYAANDYCLSLSYGRSLAQWFAFGASTKFIASTIWHTNAYAFAFDLGVMVNTGFFSSTENRMDGLSIGMSIANYGTKMRYDGMDLLQPIDPTPYTAGEYDNVEGQYRTLGWELPLIFRIGMALHPLVTNYQRLTLEIDALHPNNNVESVNIGGEYEFTLPAFGSFYLRGGYKALFMEHSEYGPAFGTGVILRMASLNNMAVRLDYAYRDVGILGTNHAYSLSLMF